MAAGYVAEAFACNGFFTCLMSSKWIHLLEKNIIIIYILLHSRQAKGNTLIPIAHCLYEKNAEEAKRVFNFSYKGVYISLLSEFQSQEGCYLKSNAN